MSVSKPNFKECSLAHLFISGTCKILSTIEDLLSIKQTGSEKAKSNHSERGVVRQGGLLWNL
jgi:hypothetical protein